MPAKEKDPQEEMLSTLKSINRKIGQLNNPPIWKSFFQGMLAGLGTVIGATVLIAILLTILRPFVTAPVIGDWISDIVDAVDVRNDSNK